ncbi:MAG: hypothetical protein AAF488_13640 [Planctomycetota bacterium]
MRAKILISLVLTLEALSLAIVMLGGPVWTTWAGFVALHAGASAWVAVLLHPLLPERLRTTPRAGMPWIGLFAFFIPYLGALALSVTLVVISRLPERDRRVPWRGVALPTMSGQAGFITTERPYGEGGILGVVSHAADPGRRVDAVLATQELEVREAVPILQVALKDAVDDVRLLAYSILDRMELEINSKIRGLLERLEDDEENVAIHYRLAHAYWELGYAGLAQGEVLGHILSKCRLHAETALGIDPENGHLHYLMGRLELKSKNFEASYASFVRAVDCGVPYESVAVFYSEIAFEERSWARVRVALRRVDPLKIRVRPLWGVARYWLEEDELLEFA